MTHSADQDHLKAEAKKLAEKGLLKSPNASAALPYAEPPRDRVNALVALFNQRRLTEVVQQATSMTAEFPTAFILHNILGAANVGLRNLDEAIASFGRALQIKPNFAPAYNNLGLALQGQGRLEEAIASFGKALQIKPDFAEAHGSLGLALQEQDRLEEAAASFGKALQIKPDYAEAHNNLGLALQAQGRLGEAFASISMALQIRPNFAEAHNSLGSVLQGQGRLDEAIASIGKALQLKSDLPQAHNNLGNVLQEQSRLEEAVASYGKALQIKPDYAEAYSNLGVVLQGLNRLEEAVASFGKALQIKPDFARVHSNLCELYEKQNDLIQLEKALEKAILNCGKDNSDILFRLAQLASGKKQFEEAAGYLKNVQVEKIQPSLKSAYFSLLGKTCDKLGKFEQAFSAFEKQNELSRGSAEEKISNADRFLDLILLLKKAWATEARPNWAGSMTGAKQISPAFLIGFPRSGTTLLDTILRSHRDIDVAEERPMVEMMSKALKQPQTIQILDKLSEAGILGLRDVYFEELKRHLELGDDSKLIVDKMPLNICKIGIIHRVLPDAKFILVLRHPCDCVLSCFMQTFELNDAMMNFLSLDRTAKVYAAVMELWSVYRQKLNLDVHVVKYEDLVQDFEGTCKSLIAFLGQEWDDNLHNYQKTALDGSRIRTPSYNQVVQPLYKQASGRWTNYRKQMEPVLPVLQPWIEAFGYAAPEKTKSSESQQKFI